jgi:hypothetical protein
VSEFIRSQIANLDEDNPGDHDSKDNPGDNDGKDNLGDNDSKDNELPLQHDSLGASQRPCTCEDLEKKDPADHRYRNFRTKLARFFTTSFHSRNISLPSGKPIALDPGYLVCNILFIHNLGTDLMNLTGHGTSLFGYQL